jgi:hypothetical protein
MSTQNKEVEKLLTTSFNKASGVTDRLLNHAYNSWLKTFTEDGLGAQQQYVDAVSACMKGITKTHGSLYGYIDSKNKDLREAAVRGGLARPYEVELDGAATTKTHALDRTFSQKGKFSNEELDTFSTLFLERLPIAVGAAKRDTETAIRKKAGEAPVIQIAAPSAPAPDLAA